MLDDHSILSLNFLSYGGIQTGDHHGMRYRMIRTGEKPDFQITAWVWPEPYCFEVTPEEKKTEAVFPFTEEGRIQAIDWMKEQYDSRREEWDNTTFIL